MSGEREGNKIWEITKNVAIGAGIILVAFAAADVVLLKTGLYMTSGI